MCIINLPFLRTKSVSPRSGELTISVIWDVMCAIALRMSFRLYTAIRAFPLYFVSTDIVGKNPNNRLPDNFCLQSHN